MLCNSFPYYSLVSASGRRGRQIAPNGKEYDIYPENTAKLLWRFAHPKNSQLAQRQVHILFCAEPHFPSDAGAVQFYRAG